MKSMMLCLALLFPIFSPAQIKTPFELSNGDQTPTYDQIIRWWTAMDHASPMIYMKPIGMSDSGFPLHLITVNKEGAFSYESIYRKNKTVILINNGIHPGEPDGIDATMLLVRDIASHKIVLPSNVVLAIVPVYNIGGCLDRSPDYRVDQNGPEEFGFRGNAQNLDLNRDFIKCDSKEARAFAEIFHLTDPEIFIDNHVSDGADYQHVMTLIATQHNKLGGILGAYLHDTLEPAIYASMKEKGLDLIPYVNTFHDKPEQGWSQFMDWPRYGSGYAALWSSFSFIPETHMLKPYAIRVNATYELMKSFIEYAGIHGIEIKRVRDNTRKAELTQSEFPLSWKSDRGQSGVRLFKGFETGLKPSEVSGLPRLYYDRKKTFEKNVPFYDYYIPTNVVSRPRAYVIPQGWWKVLDLLRLNKVKIYPLTKDTAFEVEVYHIEDYKSLARPYEMHHVNSQVRTNVSTQVMKFRKGDAYIPMNQLANRYLMEVLEPTAPDSYFAWNFFDSILGQKEGYSDYAFEEIAADYLRSHPDIRDALNKKKSEDTTFAKSADDQLEWVYKHSPWTEPAYMRYPVYRVR
jgi:hypothetical protein